MALVVQWLALNHQLSQCLVQYLPFLFPFSNVLFALLSNCICHTAFCSLSFHFRRIGYDLNSNNRWSRFHFWKKYLFYIIFDVLYIVRTHTLNKHIESGDNKIEKRKENNCNILVFQLSRPESFANRIFSIKKMFICDFYELQLEMRPIIQFNYS